MGVIHIKLQELGKMKVDFLRQERVSKKFRDFVIEQLSSLGLAS